MEKFRIGETVDIVDKIDSVKIDLDLDLDWNDFDDRGSKIRRVVNPNDVSADYSALLYSSLPDKAVYWHTHPSKESGIVYGSAVLYIGVLTDASTKIDVTEVIHLESGDTYEVDANTIHLFHFKTNCFLMVGYVPRFIDDHSVSLRLAVPQTKEEINRIYDDLVIGAKNIFK